VFEKTLLRRTFEPKREAGGDYIMRSFVTCTLQQNRYYLGNKIEDAMGGTCSTNGTDENCIQYFSWKTWREGLLRRRRCIW